MHRKQEALETELARPELYEEGAKTELMGLLEQKRLLDQELAHSEEAWLKACESLEAVEGL